MGNMLPCLFQARSNTLPPMNTQPWSRSMNLLTGSLRRFMKRPSRVSRAQVASQENSAVHHAATTSRTRRTQKNGHLSRRVVRVKVVLTRAEAARLLSLTEHGDKTASQVVREFKRMQATHANAFPAAKTAWRPVLESIPEELPQVRI